MYFFADLFFIVLAKFLSDKIVQQKFLPELYFSTQKVTFFSFKKKCEPF